MPKVPGESDRPTRLAVDVVPHVRPGVPRERRARIDPGVHAYAPDPQRRGVPAPGGPPAQRSPTPVFGTAQPLRGLSGAVRRAAYRVPEHRGTRWALLLFADRVDVLEHRIPRALWLLPLAAGLALGYATTWRVLGRER